MTGILQRLRLPSKKPIARPPSNTEEKLSLATIARMWYPLAISWTVMSFDSIIIAAILARMPDAEINLAAFGGISFAIAFILSAPISSMLSVSTALSRSWQAFARLRRFIVGVALTITAVYALIAFTPVYYWVAGDLIGAPAEIIEPGRLGLMLLMPFPFLVGYRRLQQGVMIRFGQAGGVTVSTIIRIAVETVVLLIGLKDGRLPGIAVATGAMSISMVCETVYAILRARPIIKYELKTAPVNEELTWKGLLTFFIPLSLSTIIAFSFQFINSAGMSRMPQPVESLAVFSVVSAFAWLLQGPGVAFLEVVVALLDHKNSMASLRRFTILLTSGSLLLTLVVLVTPLSMLWFSQATSLEETLAVIANNALWYFLPQSGICVLQCWFQGIIIYGRKTRVMTEAIIVSLGVELILMIGGIISAKYSGVYVASFAFTVAYGAQIFWQYLRSRPIAHHLARRDLAEQSVTAAE